MTVDPTELIAASDAARLLHLKEQTLATWRSDGKGPTFCKIGRAVFYRKTDIQEWLGKQLHDAAKTKAAA